MQMQKKKMRPLIILLIEMIYIKLTLSVYCLY